MTAPQITPPSERTITTNLIDFLDILWHQDHNQYTEVKPEIAEQLIALDPNHNNFCEDESLYHIEYPSKEFPEVLKPRVWRIKAWRNTYEKRVRDQKRSEKWRQYRYIYDDNVERLTTKIVGVMPFLSTEEARDMAQKAITKAGEDYLSPKYITVKKSIQTMYKYTLKEYKEPTE